MLVSYPDMMKQTKYKNPVSSWKNKFVDASVVTNLPISLECKVEEINHYYLKLTGKAGIAFKDGKTLK